MRRIRRDKSTGSLRFFAPALALIGAPLLGQCPYTKNTGSTTITATYPSSVISRAPAAPASGPTFTYTFAPTIPLDQYQAQKAILAQYATGNFPSPPTV